MTDRNKTRKFIGVLALSLSLILILAACGAQADTSQNTAPVENVATENTAAENTASESEMNTNTQANNNTTADEEVTENTSDDEAAEEEAPATATVSFAADVAPIIESRCANCHGGERTEGGLVLLSYAEMMAGGEDGAVIVPGDAEGSLLYELIASGKMPKRGPKVTPVELQLIEAWILEGALDN
jgi:mono/diheme cytochrome c family protein